MENSTSSQKKVFVAISAIVLCIACGVGLAIPREPPEGLEEYLIFVVVYVLLVFLVFPFWVRGLWNTVIPTIIPVKEINYWQALGLIVLVSILSVLIPD
jgi:hypothetical protein